MLQNIYLLYIQFLFLLQPVLIVQQKDNKQQLFMVALPYNTTYKLGANSKVDKLLKREEYLGDHYHTFDYPTALTNVQDKEQAIKDWYIKHCNGRLEGENFVFDYLGIKYVVFFTEANFKIYVV